MAAEPPTIPGMHSVLVVLCTFPDVQKAREVGTALVEAQLAACVNLMPGIESIYRWQGAVERAGEVLAVFKTTAEAWSAFENKLRELHAAAAVAHLCTGNYTRDLLVLLESNAGSDKGQDALTSLGRGAR